MNKVFVILVFEGGRPSHLYANINVGVVDHEKNYFTFVGDKVDTDSRLTDEINFDVQHKWTDYLYEIEKVVN